MAAAVEPDDEDEPLLVALNAEEVAFSYALPVLTRTRLEPGDCIVLSDPAAVAERFSATLQRCVAALGPSVDACLLTCTQTLDSMQRQHDATVAAYAALIRAQQEQLTATLRDWGTEHTRLQELYASTSLPDVDPSARSPKRTKSTDEPVESRRPLTLAEYQQRRRVQASDAFEMRSSMAHPSELENWSQPQKWDVETSFSGRHSVRDDQGASHTLTLEFHAIPSTAHIEKLSLLLSAYGKLRGLEQHGHTIQASFVDPIHAVLALQDWGTSPGRWQGLPRITSVRISALEKSPSKNQSSPRITPGDPLWMEILNWLDEGRPHHGVKATAAKFNCRVGLVRRILHTKKSEQDDARS